MPCFHPVDGFRRSDGSFSFTDLRRDDSVGAMSLPCGRCIGCRADQARDWTVRLVGEGRMHDASQVLTLTYADEHVPLHGSVCWSDVQKFLKRYRKWLSSEGEPSISYRGCSEYGERTYRPHYHVVIFGHLFSDRRLIGKAGDGSGQFSSAKADELWGLGHVRIGEFSAASAGYIASYLVKAAPSELERRGFCKLDPETGEIVQLERPRSYGSCRPAIGKRWWERFGATDVAPHDHCILNAKPVKVPRYYDKLLGREDEALFDQRKFERERRGRERFAESLPQRLEVREHVAKSRRNFYSRRSL